MRLRGSPSPVSSRASHTHDAVVLPRDGSHDEAGRQAGRHRQTGQAGRTTSRCWQHTTTKCKHQPIDHTRLLVVRSSSRGYDTPSPTTSLGMMHPLLCCRSGLRLTAWKHERASISNEALVVQPSPRICLRMSEDVPTNQHRSRARARRVTSSHRSSPLVVMTVHTRHEPSRPNTVPGTIEAGQGNGQASTPRMARTRAPHHRM